MKRDITADRGYTENHKAVLENKLLCFIDLL